MVSVAEFDVSNDSWLATGLLNSTQNLAVPAGFEPATLNLTRCRSNQLELRNHISQN